MIADPGRQMALVDPERQMTFVKPEQQKAQGGVISSRTHRET